MRLIKTLSMCSALFCLGCTSYYRVTDVSSGKEYIASTYYAGEAFRRDSAAFTDLRTKKTIVLKSFELEPLTKEEALALAGEPEQPLAKGQRQW